MRRDGTPPRPRGAGTAPPRSSTPGTVRSQHYLDLCRIFLLLRFSLRDRAASQPGTALTALERPPFPAPAAVPRAALTRTCAFASCATAEGEEQRVSDAARGGPASQPISPGSPRCPLCDRIPGALSSILCPVPRPSRRPAGPPAPVPRPHGELLTPSAPAAPAPCRPLQARPPLGTRIVSGRHPSSPAAHLGPHGGALAPRLVPVRRRWRRMEADGGGHQQPVRWR